MSETRDSTYNKDYWKTRIPTVTSYKKPQSKIRITFPEGVENLKLFKMAEVSAPGGLTLVLTLPFPMSEGGLGKIAETIREAGGTVEIEN